MYFFYNIILKIIIIISPIIFLIRIINGKEDPKRFLEKFSINSKKKNISKSVWIHAASVGELMSVIPILNKLEQNKKIKKIIVTTTTISSSKIFLKHKFKKTFHKYFPLDSNYIINKFINYWKPQLAIFVDSEIWPNTIKNLNDKKIPIIILNARITKHSYKKWKFFPKFANEVFKKISLALPQNNETYRYLKSLGVKNLKMAGNLKYYGEKNLQKNNLMIKKKFENFKIWCAASTHQNEEIIIGSLHKKLKKNTKNLLTIIIPRHIKRTNEIIKDLENINLKIITHSSKKLITNDTDVYLVDTYGEVSKFYELTNITFVGGSLIKHGGQNPLEPARLGNHIINGPYVNNFTEVYAFLKKNNVSLTIKNINQMKKIVSEKINYKISISNQKKIFNIGDKIISKNLFYIYKYL
tara:strand:+ start:293 stop:1528 length:1236 start_codon:yes stop_codon:yes gene_type:complete